MLWKNPGFTVIAVITLAQPGAVFRLIIIQGRGLSLGGVGLGLGGAFALTCYLESSTK
jgi:hypothetical protein